MRTIRLAAAGTALAVVLAACGSNGDSADPPAPGDGPTGEINLAVPLEARTFNPHRSQTGPFMQYLTPLYDTLIRRTPDQQLEPSLATEWGFVDEDNLVFELTLRTGVTFSDGAELTAEVVRDNILHGQAAEGPFASVLEPVAEVEVVGEQTVQLHLSAPAPTLALGLSSVMGMMISPAALGDETLDSTPAGSGPYLLSEQSVPGQEYVLTARDDYWNPDAFGPQTLVLRVMSDGEARINALRSGQVDATVVFPQQAAAVEAAGMTVLSQPLNFWGLALLDRDGALVEPLGDERVRQALNYAIDREAIVEALTFGYGQPWTQIYPPGTPAASDTAAQRYPYDPAQARTLLAAAGYPDGFTLPVIAEAQFGTYLEALDGQLREVGVQLDINLDAQSLPATWGRGEHAAPMMLYGVDDVYTATSLFALPDSVYNPFGATLPGVEEAYAGLQAAADDSGRSPYYHDIADAMTDAGWFLVTHFVESLYGVNPDRIEGVQLYRGNSLPYIYGWQATG